MAHGLFAGGIARQGKGQCMMTAICKGEPASLYILIFFSSPLERVNLEALLVAPGFGEGWEGGEGVGGGGDGGGHHI